MNFQSTIARVARLAKSLLSTAGICLLLLFVLQLTPAAARAQVTFNGALITQASGFVSPSAVAVDAGGDLFVTDVTRSYITELPIGGGAPITLGSGFSSPQGVAVDARGNVYVADKGNNAIKQIVAAGGYATINTLGSGFNQPFGVAVDANGNVLVADTSNSQVKEILAAGGYTTINVLGSGVTFSEPEGVNLDQYGNLYIADRAKSQIVELTASSGYATALYRGSGLNSPRAVTVDFSGNVFVIDKTSVKEITAASSYATVLTLNSSLSAPSGVAADASDNIYIADQANSSLQALALVGVNFATQAVGSATAGIAVPFSVSAGTTIGKVSILTTGATGLDFADAGGSTCTAQTYSTETACQVNVKFTPLTPGSRRGAVNLYDGGGNILASVPVYGVGSGPQATFSPGTASTVASGLTNPGGGTVDASGNVFIAGNGDGTIKEIPAGGGAPIVLLGGSYAEEGIAVDGAGNIFFTSLGSSGQGLDYGDLCELTAASGYKALNVLASGLFQPYGVAVDGSDNVYLASQSSTSVIEYLAASDYTNTRSLGSGFTALENVAVDASGDIFVSDGAQVFEIVAAGGYSTIKTIGSGFTQPWSVAVDPAGNVYVADTIVGETKEVFAAGGYSTVKVLDSGIGYYNNVAVDSRGNVYIISLGNGAVYKIDVADPPDVVFPTPTLLDSEDTADGPQTLTISNAGNQTLDFATPQTGSNPSYPALFPENSSDTNLCSAGLSLAVGTNCDVSLNFEPTTAGTLSGSVVLTDNALNVVGATQKIPVSGTGITEATTTALTANPTTVSITSPVTLTATVKTANGIPTGTVNFLVNGVQRATATLVSGVATAKVTLAVGVKSITASYTGAGPYLGSTSSAVTVTAVNAGISVYSGNDQTAPYGALFASPLTVALLSTTGQPLAGHTVTFVGKGVTLSNATAVTDVDGIASITATAASAGSESVVATYDTFTASFALTGTRAPLTFTATNVTVPLGQPIPSLPYSVAGFVMGDSPAVVTGAPTETTTAVQGSPAATYPITIAQGALAATNYSFVFVPGTLTVAGPGTPASITISSGNAQTTPVGTLFSAPLAVLVKNSSGKPVEGVSVSFVGSGITVSQPSVLTNASGLASVEAVPTQPGPVSVQATVAGTSLTATITGTGSAVVANPTTLNFGTIAFGTTEVKTLTITNYGVAGTITVGTAINEPSYKIPTTSQDTCLAGITAGQSCILPVEFDPVSAATHDDILTLTPSGGAATSTVSLIGTAN